MTPVPFVEHAGVVAGGNASGGTEILSAGSQKRSRMREGWCGESARSVTAKGVQFWLL
jgi:hypothetical protein